MRVFKNVSAWFLRIIAAFKILGTLYISFKMWQMVTANFEIKTFFVVLITQLLLIVLIYLIVTIFLTRADDIEALKLKNDYIVIPIFVIITKMFGEILAVTYSIIGIASAFAVWIVGTMPFSIPGFSILNGNGGIVGGILFIIAGFIFGYIILNLFYLAAELLGALVDIARNTKK